MINEKVSIKDFKELEEQVGKIGEIIQGTDLDVTSLASGTEKSVKQIVLPKGVWLIYGYVAYQPNTSGNRHTFLGQTKDMIGGNYVSDTRTGTSDNTRVSVIAFLKTDTDKTVYLSVFQDSGSTLAVISILQAIRLS